MSASISVHELAQWLCGELAPEAWSPERRAALTLAAERHGVNGLLAPASPAALALRARGIQALRFTRACVTALEAEKIPCVVLKGAATATRWSDPSVRPQTDVDLLVAPEHLRAAGDLLLAKDVVGPRVIDGEHLHNATFAPKGPGAFALELHHGLSSHHHLALDVHELLARRVSLATAQGAVPALAPEDDAVYLALHAATHALTRLAWLVDLQGLHRAGVDWLSAAARAHAWNASGAVELAWQQTRELLAVPIPEVAMRMLRVPAPKRWLAHRLLALSRSGRQAQTAERLLRLALVPLADVPQVVVQKLKANAEEAKGH